MDQELHPFSFGGLKSPEDYRRLQVKDILGEAGPLPDSFFADITKLPRWMQNQIGACTNFAAGKKKQQSEFIQTGIVVNLSPRFTYALCKKYDGVPLNTDQSVNQGTYYYMPFKIMQQYGICTEDFLVNDSTLPYDQYVDVSKISQAAYDDAKTRTIKGYAEVQLDETSLKQAIQSCNGVVVGLMLGKEWWTPSWNPADILPLKPPTTSVSGHAVYVYGWDTINGQTRFWLLNSWSDKWAIDGTGNFIYNDYKTFIHEAISIVDIPDDWVTHLKSLPPASQFNHCFNTNLNFGQTDPEITNLQIGLKIDGEFPKTIKETNYFGPITQAAVLAFQQKYGIQNSGTNGTIVGPLTRVALNKLFCKTV